MSCKKAQGFLESNKVEVKIAVDAGKNKLGRAEALDLVKDAKKIFVAKGKSVVSLDMKKDAPDEETLAALLLGPTGNLRAPTLCVGNHFYVGFSETAYQQLTSRKGG